MSIVKLLLSVLLPVLFWLVSGGPALELPDVLVLEGAAVLFLWNAIWQPVLSRALTADRYTYAPVFSTVTAMVTIIALGLVWRMLLATKLVAGSGSFFSIGPYSLGALLLLFLLTWVLPVLTIRRQDPLPASTERRELELPR